MPQNDKEKVGVLKDELSKLLREFDGSGRKIKIDLFERRGHIADDGVDFRIIHYSVLVEGLPQSSIEFDDKDEPRRRPRRPVIEAAICCDPHSGRLDVVATGGRPIREGIARAFARNILGSENGMEIVKARPFRLDRLKRPMGFDRDATDGIEVVEVLLLRLRDSHDEAGRVTVEREFSDRETLYEKSARWFGNRDPLTGGDWFVTGAKLCIAFHPKGRETRGKRITIDLRWPRSSNLRDQTHRHQLISEKYLERWGLIEAS
jgi:hypothetical protein